jgi:hypothetical protein
MKIDKCVFEGSITDSILSVGRIHSGKLEINMQLKACGARVDTKIVGQIMGNRGDFGAYQVLPGYQFVSNCTMLAEL